MCGIITLYFQVISEWKIGLPLKAWKLSRKLSHSLYIHQWISNQIFTGEICIFKIEEWAKSYITTTCFEVLEPETYLCQTRFKIISKWVDNLSKMLQNLQIRFQKLEVAVCKTSDLTLQQVISCSNLKNLIIRWLQRKE